MTLARLMDHNRDNIGLAGISLALTLFMSVNVVVQVIIPIVVPIIVLIGGHFLKRELNYRFPPKKLDAEM